MPRPNPATWVFLALAGAMFLISRTSGAGWILVILAVLLALILVNAAWAGWSVHRIDLEATSPRDAMVGQPMEVNVEARGHRSIVRTEFVELHSGPTGIEIPGRGGVTVTPSSRGVFDRVTAIVTCDAPFGLMSAKRKAVVHLEPPVEVAPRPLPHPLPASLAVAHDGDGVPQHRVGDGDVVRSLREYSVGDAPRLIHWAASARAGELRVKELEPPDHPRLEVAVDVSHPTAERAASQAAGLIRRGLNAGLPVILHTHDLNGPVSGPVGSSLEAGRRLARAVPGTPPVPNSEYTVRLW